MTRNQIFNLQQEAGAHGDMLMVAICDIALESPRQRALTPAEARRVRGMTREDALASCEAGCVKSVTAEGI